MIEELKVISSRNKKLYNLGAVLQEEMNVNSIETFSWWIYSMHWNNIQSS